MDNSEQQYKTSAICFRWANNRSTHQEMSNPLNEIRRLGLRLTWATVRVGWEGIRRPGRQLTAAALAAVGSVSWVIVDTRRALHVEKTMLDKVIQFWRK